MTWVHWVLYDLPASSTALTEAIDAAKLPPGTKPGLNDWKKLGYGGPCPPTGKHRAVERIENKSSDRPPNDQRCGTPVKNTPTQRPLSSAMNQ